MSICIFVHKGRHTYLDQVFQISRKFNPTLRMILLGDDTNRLIAAKHGVEHHPILSYSQSIPYYHYSTNSEDYEKFCFERWFVINNFVKAQGISSFVHSDSDNAFYTDISTLSYKNAFLSNSEVVVPNVLFITSENLDKICSFYNILFSLPRSDFVTRITPYGYACSKSTLHYSDMMFLRQAINELHLSFDSLQGEQGPLLFNANIRDYPIEMRHGIPFKKQSGLQLANIHFQGDMKASIPKYM